MKKPPLKFLLALSVFGFCFSVPSFADESSSPPPNTSPNTSLDSPTEQKAPHEKSVEPVKAKAIESLDQRISRLQRTKDCIKGANNKSQVQDCRRSIHLNGSNNANP